jgi:hypothetical protein
VEERLLTSTALIDCTFEFTLVNSAVFTLSERVSAYWDPEVVYIDCGCGIVTVGTAVKWKLSL